MASRGDGERPDKEYDIKFVNSLHHHPAHLEARPDISHMYADEAYLSFLAQLRQKLGEEHSGRFKGTRYLPGESQPVEHINVLLVSGLDTGSCIMLKIRRDNVYLVGYRCLDPANRPRPKEANNRNWYGFRGVDLPSTFGDNHEKLCCEGSYPDLERVARTSIEDTSLGRESLDAAINTLAESHNSGDQAEVAYSLMVIIQMVCEASRFQDLTQEIAKVYDPAAEYGSSFQPDHTMHDLYTNWDNQSQAPQELLQPPEQLQYIPKAERRRMKQEAKKAKIGNLRLAKR